MKKSISLILAIALVFTMLVFPVVAGEIATATYAATLVGDTVPNAGEKFYVAISAKDISSGLFKSGGVYWEWPAEVATPVDYYTEEPTPVTDDYCVGNIYNELVGRNGKFSYVAGFPAANKFNVGIYIPTTARDQAAEEVKEFTMYEIAFMINEGYTYDDFYLTLSDAEGFFDADGVQMSTSNAGQITLEGIEKKEEVVYESAVWQPGVDKGINTVASGVYELPETLVEGRTYEVSFKLHTHAIAGDTLVGLNNAAQMTSGNYFKNSTIMMKVDSATVKFRNGGAVIDPAGTLSSNETTVDVLVKVDLINKTWGATYTENGTVVADQSGMSFRDTGGYLPIDALVLCDNNKNAGCLTATEIAVVDTTPATVGKVTFKYVCNGVEIDTVEKNGETGATVSVEATTLTVDGVKYDAPAASGIVGTNAEVEVECVKYETVTVNYVVGETIAKTATATGLPGSTVAFDAVQLNIEGVVYVADAVEYTVAVGGNTETVELVVSENVVYASKSETWNATKGEVAEWNRVAGIDGATGMFSASWNDTRYGEAVFPVAVGADEKVKSLTVTLTTADSMSGYPQDVAIYVADAATYGTTNDLTTLVEVGTFSFGTNMDTAYTVELDLTNVVITDVEEIMLITKVTSGLGGFYGATFGEKAPYVVYELEAYEAPTEPSQPETEPSQPETEPSQPETEPSQPETEPSQPETEPSQPETEPSQPETEPSQPETEPSQPETEPSQPETEPSQPETEPSQPETEPSQPETEPSQPETEPTDEPSEEPGDEEELPFEAVDVVITPSALGITISGKFVDEDTTYETVVVVISYLKDGKAHMVQAVEVPVINGEVAIPSSSLNVADDAEYTVAGISVLVGVNALEAITTGNLGTPVGVYK